ARSGTAFVTLVRSARLEDSAVEWKPVDAAVIELEDGFGRLRAVTNIAGRVTFSGIRPGRHAVRVVYSDLPDTYRLESETYSIAVEPGGRTSLELRAIPAKRNIRIISSGEVRLDDPQREPTRPPEPQVQTKREESECLARPSTLHVVQQGESLSEMAAQKYGSAYLWPFLWLANRPAISDPDRIEIGDSIRVSEGRFEVVQSSGGDWARRTVREGETLQDIAVEELGHPAMWAVVWYTNRRTLNLDASPAPGTRLRIPSIRVSETDPDRFCPD
ncbi:MAG: LysM peptidoglycan-binding domain-containing protein, partial [Rhodothermales bacterium]|nr:LysM peptidoglycan-binding domain-containing protein [Rhodothermales bacterium]